MKKPFPMPKRPLRRKKEEKISLNELFPEEQPESDIEEAPAAAGATATTASLRTPVSESMEEAEEGKDPLSSFRWGWYGLSLLVPYAGILIGIFLYDMPSREARLVGRNCLVAGFILWVVLPLILAVVFLFLGVLTVFSWISQAMPPLN